MNGRLRWLAALSTVLVLSCSVTSARAHYLSGDSVDRTVISDPEIRWEDHSRYDDARRFAIGQWNRLGRVDIVPDNAITVTDVEFIDFSRCDVTWEAFWTGRRGADAIGFNPCRIRRRLNSPPDPRAVAVHEVGHALGLAHPKCTEYWLKRSIMHPCPRCTSTSTYRDHDIGDYRRRW